MSRFIFQYHLMLTLLNLRFVFRVVFHLKLVYTGGVGCNVKAALLVVGYVVYCPTNQAHRCEGRFLRSVIFSCNLLRNLTSIETLWN